MFKYINEILAKASSVATVNYFKEIISDGPIKFFACIGTTLTSVLSTFLLPIWVPIIAVGILIIIDMILGIRSLMICCGHLVDEYIISSIDLHLVEGFAGLVAGVELWSMVENLQTLDPTGPWKIFSKFIKKKGEKYLDITIDKEDLPKIKKLVKKIK